MNGYPETRLTLIARLKDRADREAWDEFVEIYQPVIYRLACRKGLQHADAEDLVQQVFTAVATAVEGWEPDPTRGRFRSWLRTIAHNRILNILMRRAPDRASGGAPADDPLDRHAAKEGPGSSLLRLEQRREVFNWAAREIEGDFEPETWQAFWLTTVEGRDIGDVARLLGKKRGAIYVARGRVMHRLKEKIKEWDDTV